MVSTDSAKKELSKSDGLGPRYNQSCGVGVHVDISTQQQEGVKATVVHIRVTSGHLRVTIGNFFLSFTSK